MSIAKKLITIVKQHPILYDTSHADHRNTEKKEAIWEQIADELKENIIEVKKRWRNLRDTYVKLLKLVKGGEKDPVFEAAAVRKYQRWVWTKEMEFFRTHLTYGNQLNVDSLDKREVKKDATPKMRPMRNVPPKAKSMKSIKRESLSPSPIEEPPSKKRFERTMKLREQKPSKQSTNIKEKLLSQPEKTLTSLDLDATDRLFLAHAQNIKQFSARRQALTKLKIAEVIMQQEILHQEDMELSSLSANAAREIFKRRSENNESPPAFETVCGYTSEDEELNAEYDSVTNAEEGEEFAIEEFIQ